MKKIFTLLLISLFVFANAQNFKITDDKGELIPTNTTLTYNITQDDLDPDAEWFAIHLLVNNITENNIPMYVKRTEIELVPGSASSYCVGINCVAGDEMFIEELEPGEHPFDFDFIPGGNYGYNKIQFDFWSGSEENKITVFFEITFTNKVNENTSKNYSATAYPNPVSTSQRLQINYSLPISENNAQLVMRNIMGAPVLTLPLIHISEQVSVDLSSFKAGIYFYSIESNGKAILTKKVVVK